MQKAKHHIQSQQHQKYLFISFLCFTNFFLDKFLWKGKYQPNLLLERQGNYESTIYLPLFGTLKASFWSSDNSSSCIRLSVNSCRVETTEFNCSRGLCPLLFYFQLPFIRRETRWYNSETQIKQWQTKDLSLCISLTISTPQRRWVMIF